MHSAASLFFFFFFTVNSRDTVDNNLCFQEGAGLACAHSRVAASATSIPSPLKPSHKCKHC